MLYVFQPLAFHIRRAPLIQIRPVIQLLEVWRFREPLIYQIMLMIPKTQQILGQQQVVLQGQTVVWHQDFQDVQHLTIIVMEEIEVVGLTPPLTNIQHHTTEVLNNIQMVIQEWKEAPPQNLVSPLVHHYLLIVIIQNLEWMKLECKLHIYLPLL